MNARHCLFLIFILSWEIAGADTIFFRPKSFISNTCNDFALQAQSPFKRRNAINTLCVVGVCAALIPLDASINRELLSFQPTGNLYKESINQISRLGGSYGYIALGTAATVSLLCKNQKAFEHTMLATRAAITTAIWIRILKSLSGRERPYYQAGNSPVYGRWNGPAGIFRQLSERGKYDAFPSGHTGTAFALAGAFAMAGADTPWIPPLCYGTAALVGFSRLSKNEHWLSDVVLGAVIGLACARQVFLNETKYHKRVFNKKNGLQSLRLHIGMYPLM